MGAGVIFGETMLALFLAGDAVALDLAGSASITGCVLLARRGESLCELVDLVLYELGGEDETWQL